MFTVRGDIVPVSTGCGLPGFTGWREGLARPGRDSQRGAVLAAITIDGLAKTYYSRGEAEAQRATGLFQ